MTATDAPLLLLHGVMMSETVWDEVIPALGDRREVIAMTAMGHRGGPPATRHPTRVEDLIDDVERRLDDLAVPRAHIAGNSLGGWMSIELARRGRAVTVCAISPAGFWDTGAASNHDATARLRREVALARVGRHLAAPAMRVPLLRRTLLRNIADHGDRITAAQATKIVGDLTACAVSTDLLSTRAQIAPLRALPCPITVAWAEHDRIFPPSVNGVIARLRLPDARFVVLSGVGHVPMIDDPALVAATILESIERADS
ncbi:alpha/beta fold hydrolase [Nocardia sp. NPDC005366]|uniref:alpha/beta fold hydrolase n=1 Tax=Nocardia sp. NPDC005366 TaxID=3156878 RepID=UPI0033B90E21